MCVLGCVLMLVQCASSVCAYVCLRARACVYVCRVRLRVQCACVHVCAYVRAYACAVCVFCVHVCAYVCVCVGMSACV